MLVAHKKIIIGRAREKPTVYNETRILLSMKIFIVVNAVNYSELSLLISNNMFISLALIQMALRHTVFSVFVTRFVQIGMCGWLLMQNRLISRLQSTN